MLKNLLGSYLSDFGTKAVSEKFVINALSGKLYLLKNTWADSLSVDIFKKV